jgi:hypothetical protein
MKIRITLDDDAAAIAAQYAQAREITLSKAISELIRRGTRKSARIKSVDGLPVFDLPKSKRRITTRQVKVFESED